MSRFKWLRMFKKKFHIVVFGLLMVFGTGVASYSYAGDLPPDFQSQLNTHRLGKYEASKGLLKKIRDLKLSYGRQSLGELISRANSLSFPMSNTPKKLIDVQASIDQYLSSLSVGFLNKEKNLRKERDKVSLEVAGALIRLFAAVPQLSDIKANRNMFSLILKDSKNPSHKHSKQINTFLDNLKKHGFSRLVDSYAQSEQAAFAYKSHLVRHPELKSYIEASLKLKLFLKNNVTDNAPMGTLISPFELGYTNYQTSVLFKKTNVRGKLG